MSLVYRDPLPLAHDATPYRIFTRDGLALSRFEGEEILKVEPGVLTRLTREVMRDAAFLQVDDKGNDFFAGLDQPE